MNFMSGEAEIKIYNTREEMGKVAADNIASEIKSMLTEKEEINMIFAAAPSQSDMFLNLVKMNETEWQRINAFHMDEYIGLNACAPQCFSNFLKKHIFDKVPFKSVNLLNPAAKNVEEECCRYSALLEKHPVDIVCMGIGENGHIAFNDPKVAEFNDKKTVKIVELDNICRMQQVHDGCFPTINDVPRYAITLTVPALMSGKRHFCIVPSASKAIALERTVYGEISEECPATILRTKKDAKIYCDRDSAKFLLEKEQGKVNDNKNI